MIRSPRGRTLAVGVAVVVCLVGSWAMAREPIRVLMIVGGQYHDYETLPKRLVERLERHGDMTITATDELADLEPGRLPYDVLMFNVCRQDELSSSQRRAILNHLADGRGLVSMHCSLWSFQSWTAWADMLGGFAPGHDALGTYELTVLEPEHPILRGPPPVVDATRVEPEQPTFTLVDEPYLIDARDPTATVLIRTSRRHQDGQGNPRPTPEPQVWVKRVGEGRIFVATFGHDEQSQRDPRFVILMSNGIRWAAGRLPDALPAK